MEKKTYRITNKTLKRLKFRYKLAEPWQLKVSTTSPFNDEWESCLCGVCETIVGSYVAKEPIEQDNFYIMIPTDWGRGGYILADISSKNRTVEINYVILGHKDLIHMFGVVA